MDHWTHVVGVLLGAGVMALGGLPIWGSIASYDKAVASSQALLESVEALGAEIESHHRDELLKAAARQCSTGNVPACQEVERLATAYSE